MADSSAPKISSLWGDQRFSDATIIMGQRTWHVHRWLICKQSQYFEKALEGHFIESNTKTIDLTDSQFLEEQVDGMLRYLYHQELEPHQKKDPIATFLVADYFQVTALRAKASEELSMGLKHLALKKYFVNFKKWCHIVLGQHSGTPLEDTVIKVVADNLQMVMHESGAWNELTDAYPKLAKKVLEVICPKPEPVTTFKRPAGVAFDDTLQSGRSGKGHGLRHGSTNYYG